MTSPAACTLFKVPTVDTNLVQSLINIMECQLEQAFDAAATGTAGRKMSASKRKVSTVGEGGVDRGGSGALLDPKVCDNINIYLMLVRCYPTYRR